MEIPDALATLGRVEMLGFATGQPILNDRYMAAARVVVAKLGAVKCVEEIDKAVEGYMDSHPEQWHVEHVPPIITREQFYEVNGLLMAEEGVESWLSGYLENIFGRCPENWGPFVEAFDNLRATIRGKDIDELATAVNRLSNGRVKALARELGMKIVGDTLRVAAYNDGVGLLLASWSQEGDSILDKAEAIARAKEFRERKTETLRKGILTLLAHPEKVMARLDEVAGFGLTEMRGDVEQ
jgi:hypothetical protein